ncbi:hypothetical protein DHEL01_v207920 [Diaporthe helianthi]|uniref:Uncharacterized protein n=1 Tax=Diaporthe helianthi TaxID=158607 RepID=A0A2P5HTU4_DIAHE|nr:hypothetical protein DHEL01_v207920 [Diaporthe helianthi]
MNDKLYVWLDDKPHSVEGHNRQCTLFFKDNQVWGPKGCHYNTTSLADAIQKADDRFVLRLEPKPHSVEGHTRYISVKSRGQLLLNRMSTHDNMAELVAVIDAIETAQAKETSSTVVSETVQQEEGGVNSD